MKFQISDELKEKIERILKDNSDLKNELLLGNPDAIREVATMFPRGIAPEDVI